VLAKRLRVARRYPHIDPVVDGGSRPFWSVMIPSYNAADLLRATLESVLAQDPGPEVMQIRVVDDASTIGDPAEVVATVGKGRVEFYRHPSNVGPSQNFTSCLRQARGEWIHILHSDDLVAPGFYRAYRGRIESTPNLVMVTGPTTFVDSAGRSTGAIGPLETEDGCVRAAAATMATLNPAQFVSTVVSRTACEKLGGFHPDLFHTNDWEMWVRLAAYGRVGWVDQPLALYRVHPDSDTSRVQRSTAYLQDCARAVDLIVAQFDDTAEKARIRVLATRRVAAYGLNVSDDLLRKGAWRLAAANAVRVVSIDHSPDVRTRAIRNIRTALSGRLSGLPVLRTIDGLRRQVDELAARTATIEDDLQRLLRQSTSNLDAETESLDSIRLRGRRPTFQRTRVRVLFLVHLIEAWDSYHQLVQLMQEADDFEPVVVSIPRHFNGDVSLNHERETHLGLQAAGIQHLRLGPHDMEQALRVIKEIDPDLIFRQSQWDDDVAPEISAQRLGFARTCLVPYETMNIVENAPTTDTDNSAVDAPYHRGAWAVFCANEKVLEMARRDGILGGIQFHVTGHPKADRIRSAEGCWPVKRTDGHTATRRVAWSAHHTIGTGWTDFGMFHLIHEDMLKWAQSRLDTDFVFLPHPALIPYTGSASSPLSRAEFEIWHRAWESLPNTATYVGQCYPSVLAASDALVVDGLSFLVEYQLLQKPLVFLERIGHRPFNEIGRLVCTGVHPVRTVAEARSTLDELLGPRSDPLADRQRQNCEDLFGDPGSAERILNTLRNLIAAERGVVQ
jgi:glycosyltransferase involved in cell wall biosynthesis